MQQPIILPDRVLSFTSLIPSLGAPRALRELLFVHI